MISEMERTDGAGGTARTYLDETGKSDESVHQYSSDRLSVSLDTTMIYAHVFNQALEVSSPLDQLSSTLEVETSLLGNPGELMSAFFALRVTRQPDCSHSLSAAMDRIQTANLGQKQTQAVTRRFILRI